MHADHLYQMFAYVKNCAASLSGAGQVSGLLLYAHNPDRPVAARTYRISGSCISTRSLDLGGSFEQVAAQLDQIAADYFQLSPPRPEKQMSR